MGSASKRLCHAVSRAMQSVSFFQSTSENGILTGFQDNSNGSMQRWCVVGSKNIRIGYFFKIEVMWYGNWCVIDQPKTPMKTDQRTYFRGEMF